MGYKTTTQIILVIIAVVIMFTYVKPTFEKMTSTQEETGEYGSENTIIAYMGFVPNFNNYRLVTLPDQETWYESTDIYTNNMLLDNIEGFYQMAGQSLETLIEMRELQPKL